MITLILISIVVAALVALALGSVAFQNSQGSTGTLTITLPSGPGVAWNVSSIIFSQAGGVIGPGAKLTVTDGAIGVGTVIYSVFLAPPLSQSGLGSVGIVQEIPLPLTPSGLRSLQGTPGNAMNIQVVGTGNNSVSLNVRASDGLPTGP